MKNTHKPYWADQFADQIIKSGKYKPYWVDDMKTPSGRVHIGSVRAVLTHEFVYRSLIDRGVKATFSYVLEDHDPFDKIPSYLDQKKYQKHIGKPLFQVPSPETGYRSYGHRWGQEYIDIFNNVGAHPKIIWGSDLYLSGRMNSVIKECLDNAATIIDIYRELYGQDSKTDDWIPFNPACEKCKKILTTKPISWDGKKIAYECYPTSKYNGCGYKGKRSPFSSKDDYAGKLPWKVEWACKWKTIGITIEGAGKDHFSAGSSHDLSSLICKRVINYPIPFGFGHEFFLTGGRKMSSSKGIGSSAMEVAKIIPPFLIRFMVARVRYNRAINFDPNGDTIPDLYDAFDQAAQAYWNQSDLKLARIFELSQVNGAPPQPHFQPRFRDVAKYLQDPKVDLKEKFAVQKGKPLTTEEKKILQQRISYAKIWLKDYAPLERQFQISATIPEEARSLSAKQKSYLQSVATLLDKKWDSADSLQQALYEQSKRTNLSPKEAFQAIYRTLIGKTHGPKAAWLLQENAKLARERFANIDTDRQQTKPTITSTKTNRLKLHPAFAREYPSARIGYALIKGVKIEKFNQELEDERQAFLKDNAGLTTQELGEYPEIQSYRRMYKNMGVDWHSCRPSPEALLRRLATGKGLYPPINTSVDAYNLVVMKHRVSVGTFDADAIKFPCELRICQGGERGLFIGDKTDTKLTKGEVCYFDQIGPYNMDYNYRDAIRSLATEETKNIWINTEGVYEITPEQVQATLDETIQIVTKYCGGKVTEQGILLAQEQQG